MTRSIQAPTSTLIVTHPIETDGSLRRELEIFNQEESNSHFAAVKVAMQERADEIARVSRMNKSTPNVGGQAANGTGLTQTITDADLQRFSDVLKKKGLKVEKRSWPGLESLVCTSCTSKNRCVTSSDGTTCGPCKSSRLRCSRGAAFARWRTIQNLQITEARFDVLKAALDLKAVGESEANSVNNSPKTIKKGGSTSKKRAASHSPSPAPVSKIQRVLLKLPEVPDIKGTFTSSREQGGEVNSGEASGSHPSLDKVSFKQDEMNSGEARRSPERLVRSESEEDDRWSPEYIGTRDSIWDAIHQAYEEYLDDQRRLAFEREMDIFFIIRGIRDKVVKVANDPDTPQERLTNQLHEIDNQLQHVEHTALWQASLQRERQSIGKNARRLIPVVDWASGAAQMAEQRVAAAELLQDTHHTYVDDEGTRRYTRGAKGKGRA